MGYVSVREESESRLCLLREPTLLSKAVFVAFFVGIFGVFLFGSESLFFKVLIGVGATSLSFLLVDNYEICEFDKTTGEVRLTRLHWCQFWLGELNLLAPQAYVTARLADIKDVRVEEQEGGNSGGKAYQVILCLEAGIQLGVTEVFTTDDISEHTKCSNLIQSFLRTLPPPKESSEKVDDILSGDVDKDAVGETDDENSSTDDDFEQISSAELESLEKDMNEEIGQAAGDAIVQGEQSSDEGEKKASCTEERS